MSSNSKLESYQKTRRKALREEFLSEGGVIVRVEGVTVALKRSGKSMGQFSVSVCSEGEIKDRRKVGEFYALDRFYFGNRAPVRLRSEGEMYALGFSEEHYLASRAQDIAEAVCS